MSTTAKEAKFKLQLKAIAEHKKNPATSKLRPRDQIFNMTYERPTANNPVMVSFPKHPEWSGKYTEQQNGDLSGLGQRFLAGVCKP